MRPIHQIASEIKITWQNPYFGARPYLDAMFCLNSPNDKYGLDSAKSIILYFLSNATTWRGEDAKRIKSELKNLIK
jgi:hypothetical protein